jgi:type IV/VI secretion system ImpK/VasF family protein
MTKVDTLFADLFAYVLLFEQAHLQGEFQPSYEQVRQDIAALFEREKATAKRQGILDKDVQDAGFAVVAWADETILKHATWKSHHEWNRYPLQLEYYQTRNAGEEFFERLEKLGAAQQTVREVYYFCLGLGFSGQYFLGLEDELKLRQIRQAQATHLTSPIESVQDIDKITAQPYEVRPPLGQPVRRPLTHLLLQAGLVLLIVVPLVYGGLKLWSSAPTSPPPAVVQLPPAPVPKEESMRDTKPRPPESISCEKYEPIQRPFCAVLDLLEPIKKQAADRRIDLVTSLNKAGNIPDYYDKESLVITGKTPTKFESYVYIDYYGADGTVGHLLPNPHEGTNHLESNQLFTVGKLNGQPYIFIKGQPPGLELITVIASKSQLFSVLRNDETAESYLNELRQALSKDNAKPDVAAMFHFIRTKPKPSPSRQ